MPPLPSRASNPRALGSMCWLEMMRRRGWWLLCSCCSHEPWLLPVSLHLLLLHQHTLSEGQTVGRSQMPTRIFGSVWMWDSSCHFIRSLFGLVASFHPMHVGQGMKRRGECGVKAATRGPASSLYSFLFLLFFLCHGSPVPASRQSCRVHGFCAMAHPRLYSDSLDHCFAHMIGSFVGCWMLNTVMTVFTPLWWQEFSENSNLCCLL